jgi:hypothetical protein
MQAVRLKAMVGDDHRLEMVVPDEIPVGEVEVIVLVSRPAGACAEQSLSELFAEIDRMPHKGLAKEDVDRYLAKERASWD